MLRKLAYPLVVLALAGGTVTVLSSPAAASTTTRTAKCEIELDGDYNLIIENTTEFRISSAGRVHVNRVTSKAYRTWGMGNVDVRLDYDLRFKDTNGLLKTWSSTGGETWRPENGETVRGLKTTVRGWDYWNEKSCNATVSR